MNQFRIKSGHTHVISRRFSGFFYFIVNFIFGEFYRFFNFGRMDPSVSNQFFHGNFGNFSSDRIKTGNDNRFRRIINNNFNTSESFQRFDISSFASDYPAFYFIRSDTHRAGGHIGRVRSGIFLDSLRHDVFGFLVQFFRPDVSSYFIFLAIKSRFSSSVS